MTLTMGIVAHELKDAIRRGLQVIAISPLSLDLVRANPDLNGRCFPQLKNAEKRGGRLCTDVAYPCTYHMLHLLQKRAVIVHKNVSLEEASV